MSQPASDADFPSGPWTGFFQVDGRRVHQDLELTFSDGVLRGGGWDALGEFVVRGSYDLDSREVRITKKYEDQRVSCRGFREGMGIWGTWESGRQRGAGFHIWPLQAGPQPATSPAP